MTKSIDTFLTPQSASLIPTVHSYIQTRRRWKTMESVRIFLVKNFRKHILNGVRAVNETKTPILFPEAESIFPGYVRNLIDGS